jgi:phospholipase/carboxylesterase
MDRLKTYTHKPLSGSAPKHVVILLHGLGANGIDLLGLARYWEQAVPDAIFISPDAPFPCDMAPVGFQWFSLQDRRAESMLLGVEEAAPILNDYIDGVLAHYDLTDENLALVGFSQGTMMSLYAGPRRTHKIAGILGYSGALIGGEELSSPGIQKPPVTLIHGDSDSVVPIDAYYHAKETLERSGFDVDGDVRPYLDHGIDDEGIAMGAKFLSKIFS